MRNRKAKALCGQTYLYFIPKRGRSRLSTFFLSAGKNRKDRHELDGFKGFPDRFCAGIMPFTRDNGLFFIKHVLQGLFTDLFYENIVPIASCISGFTRIKAGSWSRRYDRCGGGYSPSK